MTLWLFSTLIISILLAIPVAAAPLSLGLWIWILALITAILSAYTLNSWFGFIIFLIYIGGMLVIFAYFSAISPNQHLFISQIISVTALPIILWTAFLLLQPLYYSFTPPLISPSTPTAILLNTAPLTLLALILFITLIAVTKISSFAAGPLRPFSYVPTITKIASRNQNCYRCNSWPPCPRQFIHMMKLWVSSGPMPCCTSNHGAFPSHTFRPSYWYSLLFHRTHYPRRKLWMIITKPPCKWWLHIFPVYLPTRCTGNLLRLFSLHWNLKFRSNYYACHNSNCFCWLCLTVRPNKFLSSHCNYQPILCNPLHWKHISRMDLRGIRS